MDKKETVLLRQIDFYLHITTLAPLKSAWSMANSPAIARMMPAPVKIFTLNPWPVFRLPRG